MKKILNALLIVAGTALLASPMVNADDLKNKDTETTSQYVSAAATTVKVKAALLAKKKLNSTEIEVTSVDAPNGNGAIVTLTGTQPNQTKVELAGEVARGVSGVSEVKNELKAKRKK
ncbi:MAG: hypothetical protein K0R49_761 [Burkholderiales bacterium]|jgi:osmotically-inducible protein OsmY|nr:hypothetical protein [Burkholderiales bacterium]MCE3268509.1 hypothetical protein [Burkholderiales bacterium]